ncbi:MAG: hypothetical protein R8G66_15590 [Cytophagales bacterium]|nr:hypothetical protein [Cytophagales bacterium]
MRTLFFLLFLGGACTTWGSTRTFKTFDFQGKAVTYAIQLPDDFDPNKTYPVAIGPSEVKSEGDQSFYWRKTTATYGWILVDFTLYESSQKQAQVVALMDHLRTTYKVEGNKFHTICFSANSASIFDLVMSIPNHFHSITGMAGNPGTTNKNKLSQLKGVKVSFVVGDNDNYWMNAAKDRHQRLLDAGVNSRIEIIKNGPHVMRKLIGKGTIERMDQLR